MHEHAAILHFFDPPENGVTDCTVHVDVDDVSDIRDNASESGPMSVSMSVSNPTCVEVSTSTGDQLNLTTVVECVNPPTCMTPTELNSSYYTYFMNPVENSTSLENETMSFICTKYPHLREQVQSLHNSGKKWDDMINEISNKRDRATTVKESLTDGINPYWKYMLGLLWVITQHQESVRDRGKMMTMRDPSVMPSSERM